MSLLGEVREDKKGPRGPPELPASAHAEPLSNPGHQSFQGHHLPSGSLEAPLRGPEAVAAASKLSKKTQEPGTGQPGAQGRPLWGPGWSADRGSISS